LAWSTAHLHIHGAQDGHQELPPDSVLGTSGFRNVYKGWVDEKTMAPTRNNTDMVDAIKKLNSKSMQGMRNGR
jgi:hypothetical protein